MKNKPFRFALAAAALLSVVTLAACDNAAAPAPSDPVASSPAPVATVSASAVKAGATIATQAALSIAVPNVEQRRIVAADAFAAAGALRAFSAGTPPNVGDFDRILRQYGGKDIPPAYALIVGSLTSLYQSFYPSLVKSSNSKEAAALLEALAEGVEAGSSGSM